MLNFFYSILRKGIGRPGEWLRREKLERNGETERSLSDTKKTLKGKKNSFFFFGMILYFRLYSFLYVGQYRVCAAEGKK